MMPSDRMKSTLQCPIQKTLVRKMHLLCKLMEVELKVSPYTSFHFVVFVRTKGALCDWPIVFHVLKRIIILERLSHPSKNIRNKYYVIVLFLVICRKTASVSVFFMNIQ